jgi:hypothetical protein
METICTSWPTVAVLPLGGLVIDTLGAPPPVAGPQARIAASTNTAARITARKFLSLNILHLLSDRISLCNGEEAHSVTGLSAAIESYSGSRTGDREGKKVEEGILATAVLPSKPLQTAP